MTKTVSEKAVSCLTWDSNDVGVCSNCCVTFKQANKYGIVCKKIDFIDKKQQVTSVDSIPAIYDTIFSSIVRTFLVVLYKQYSVHFLNFIGKIKRYPLICNCKTNQNTFYETVRRCDRFYLQYNIMQNAFYKQKIL